MKTLIVRSLFVLVPAALALALGGCNTVIKDQPVPPAGQVVSFTATPAELAKRPPPPGDVIIVDHCGPYYASITEEAQHAVRLAARTEALVLDPVYSGKAMAGLIAGVKDGRLTGTIVFLHTGGAPALFADEFAKF